jgi:hypothetical protein
MLLETKYALSTLHVSMNTFSKINRLPPEVLALIPSFLTSPKDLILTTHVCRRWRNTITASPPLWSSLDNDTMHTDLIATYMDRCGGAPLDVSFSSELDKNAPFLKRVVLHSSHIRRMRIPCIPWSRVAEISDAFDTPLPLLQDIELSVGYDELLIPPLFQRPFLAGATNLVSLDLSDCSVPSGTFRHFIIPTLTHLKLLFGSPRTPSVGEILGLLRTSPLIEDLQIHSDDVRDTSEGNFPFLDWLESVDLPYLRNIHLSWSTPRSQNTLLSHIRYPPNCSVSLQVCSDSDIAEPPRNTFPKSWDAFSVADLSCVTLRMKREQFTTECVVVVEKPDGALVSISRLQNVDNFVLVDGEGNLIRDLSRDRDDDHVFSDAIALVGKLPLQCVRKFVLEDLKADEMSAPESFAIPPALAKLISSDMPNLVTLSLTRTCVSELLKILTPLPPPPPTYAADLFDSNLPSEQITPPCPALRVLEMRHPVWKASRNCPEVLALAKARKHERIPLERVFFCSPTVPKSMRLGMSLYVGEIDIQKCNVCE